MTETPTQDPPLLSLCVPTYNRAALLPQALRAILTQITPDMAGRVEVVILDNASPDDTPDVVREVQAEFPHAALRSVRRPENIGPDANMCDAPNQAHGTFVYLLSDDDVLLPGAVATLLRLIGEHPDVDAFALNVREFLHSPDEDMPGLFVLPEDSLLGTCDEALTFLRFHITFLSCIAFRRANVAGRDYSRFSGTIIGQAYMFLDALAPGCGLYVAVAPFLARRADNSQGFGFFQVFVTQFQHLLQYAREVGYSDAAVRETFARHREFLYQCVLDFKTRGGCGTLDLSYRAYLEAAVLILRAYGPDRFVTLMIVPRMLVPSGLFAPMQRLYTGLKARVTGKPPAGRAGGKPRRA